MRRYPLASIITRTALQDFQLGGYLIPEGTVLCPYLCSSSSRRSLV
nr:cytochrome P450 [Rhizobium laguerreae]